MKRFATLVLIVLVLAGSATGAIGGTDRDVAQVQNNSTETTTSTSTQTNTPTPTGTTIAEEPTARTQSNNSTTETSIETTTSQNQSENETETTTETPETEANQSFIERINETVADAIEDQVNRQPLAKGSAPNVEIRAYHSPSHPKQIRFLMTTQLPEDMNSFRLRFSGLGSKDSNSGVISSNGFDISSTGYAEWDESTYSPTLIYAVNVTDSIENPEEPDYAGRSDWILAPTPNIAVDWMSDSSSDYVRPLKESSSENVTVSVSGAGIIGQRVTYMGEYSEYTLTDNGQHLRLVVPEQADLGPTPHEILHSISLASEQLHVGSRDSEVLMIAAPEPIRSGGYAYTESDELVVGDEGGILFDGPALNTPNNVWLHEYIHTRQSFVGKSKMGWFTEASAEYYAALLTYKQQRTSNAEALEQLKPGKYGDAVLADRSTWSDSRFQRAPYEKGSAVLYALDQKIRSETDSKKSLMDVFRRMNNRSESSSGVISLSDFKEIVTSVSGTSMNAWIDRYVTTRQSPPLNSGNISILSGSGRIKEVATEGSTDSDEDGYSSDFQLSIRADTTLDETDSVGVGEPYFEIRVEGETLTWTDTTTQELDYGGTVTINEEKLEQFERGELNVTVVLWDDDVSGDDLIDQWSLTVNYEPDRLDSSNVNSASSSIGTETPSPQPVTTTATAEQSAADETPIETQGEKPEQTVTQRGTQTMTPSTTERTETVETAQSEVTQTTTETPITTSTLSKTRTPTAERSATTAGTGTEVSDSTVTETASPNKTKTSEANETSDKTATNTQNENGGTETSTTGPGFGIIAAIIALIAAGLFATRRI